MTNPSEPSQGRPDGEGVNLGKDAPDTAPDEDVPFDPYRFGKPDYPIPAEYAPPGYTGPVTPPVPPPVTPPYGSPYGSPYANPYGGAPQPGGPAAGSPYASSPDNPFGNPPGSSYGNQPGDPYGQQPPQYPPTYPYGAPPPPPQYPGYGQPRPSSGKAVAALVLGICAIVFCWLSFFDAVFVILGLIFSLLALNETRSGARRGRGMAIAGLVCTIVGAVLATIFTVWIVHAANQCGGFSNSNAPGWEQCIRDNL